MSGIRYIYRDFDDPPKDQLFNLHISEENTLKKFYDDKHFENYISYSNPESRHVQSFECGVSRATPGYSLLNRQLRHFLILYVYSGAVYYNGLKMHAGDAVFVEPYFVHSMVHSTNEPPKLYWVMWEGDITVHLAQMLRNYVSDKVYRVGFNDSMANMFEAMIYNPHLGDIGMKQYVVGFTDMMLAYLTKAVLNDTPDKSGADLIGRAKALIDTGYADITVDQLANLLYVNSKYLSKVFRRYTGMTPKKYITDVKMIYAEHYLISTAYPILKISEIVGYNNYTNFYIAFKNKYGIAPEDYRHKYADAEVTENIPISGDNDN